MIGIQKLEHIIMGSPGIPISLVYITVQPTFQGRKEVREGEEESNSNFCGKLSVEGKEACHNTAVGVFSLFQNNCQLLFS